MANNQCFVFHFDENGIFQPSSHSNEICTSEMVYQAEDSGFSEDFLAVNGEQNDDPLIVPSNNCTSTIQNENIEENKENRPKKRKSIKSGFITSKTTSGRKYRSLTLKEKFNLLQAHPPSQKIHFSSLSKESGVPESTLYRIFLKRSEIEERYRKIPSKSKQKNTKARDRQVTHPLLDHAIWLWFIQCREQNIPLTFNLIREQAKVFHETLCTENACKFSASKGWIEKFKNRYELRTLAITGEKLSADESAIAPFLLKLFAVIKNNNLSLHQIYNADESGLNYKMLPNSTVVGQNERCAPGHKVNKDRITFMPCVNASGTHKLPLNVIGKSKNPRCFVNNKPGGIYYSASNKAWQTKELFKTWMKDSFIPETDRFLKENNLPSKRLLLLDNCSAHNIMDVDEINTNDDVIVMFLPPNLTSLIQPLDQNVIQPVKNNYKKSFLKRILTATNENSSILEAVKKVNLSDAIQMLVHAWNELDQYTIYASWKNLLSKIDIYNDYNLTPPNSSQNNQELLNVQQLVQKMDKNVTDDAIFKWLNNPEENLAVEVYENDDILKIVKGEFEREFIDDTDQNMNDDDSMSFMDTTEVVSAPLHSENPYANPIMDNVKKAIEALNTLIEIETTSGNMNRVTLLHSWRENYQDMLIETLL